MVLYATDCVVPSGMPIYRPIPASPVTPKGETNQYVGCRVSSFSEFQVILETHPVGVFLVWAASYRFMGSSSNFLACFVIILFFLFVSCRDPRYAYHMYVPGTGFRSRMLHAEEGAVSVPPPSQFHSWRCKHHLSPTAHTAMLCIHKTYQVLVRNACSVYQ